MVMETEISAILYPDWKLEQPVKNPGFGELLYGFVYNPENAIGAYAISQDRNLCAHSVLLPYRVQSIGSLVLPYDPVTLAPTNSENLVGVLETMEPLYSLTILIQTMEGFSDEEVKNVIMSHRTYDLILGLGLDEEYIINPQLENYTATSKT